MKLISKKPDINVAAGLIFRKGKILICKRPEGSHLAGYWEFPGGKQEKGETLEECLSREIKEELGIEIDAEKQMITVQHEYEIKQVTLHFFRCRTLKGTPRAREGQEIRWVDQEDLSKYRFPPPDLRVIEIITADTTLKEIKRNSG